MYNNFKISSEQIPRHNSDRTTPNSSDDNKKQLNFFGIKSFSQMVSPNKSDMSLTPNHLYESHRVEKSSSVFSGDGISILL